MVFQEREPGELYLALVEQVEPQAITHMVIGLNWTLVATDQGCGLAHSPARDSEGCKPVEGAGQLGEKSLDQLASLTMSENPAELSIGVAAINAYFNRFDLAREDENGLDVFSGIKEPVTVLGRFPGLDKRLRDPRIIEREPREGEYSTSEMAHHIGESGAVIITASTLTNGSLPGVLEHCAGKRVSLVGPGTTLAPTLFEFGIEILAGTLVHDVDGAVGAVAQGGAVRALRPHCRFVTLRRPHAAAK